MLMLVPQGIQIAGYDLTFDRLRPRWSRVSHVRRLAVAFLEFHGGEVNLGL